ncbi:TransThyretin-Related family domain [Caenorhabditis elegans]|uniref:TransThyretin-Related family domain n=1 Tax=Caenorhabditis elegans TaxID=6239 RepID=Q4R149_CAEEL|nr:TransThyretin-Related family domain [Caenorhabditis elegans]CCD74305.1 TransThyretin-Related family domain [Caenorhabditis elegans]|eukprot:NP_001033508.1 Uncharacterized protein CELE_Y32G9A.12 [Caenorhabditis elegans]
MNQIILSCVLLLAILGISYASLAQMKVKEGARVKIQVFRASKGVKIVKHTERIIRYDGKRLVDGAGLEIDSSNYEYEHGDLFIKKFGKADEGLYSPYPANLEIKNEGNGSFSGVPVPAIRYTIDAKANVGK